MFVCFRICVCGLTLWRTSGKSFKEEQRLHWWEISHTQHVYIYLYIFILQNYKKSKHKLCYGKWSFSNPVNMVFQVGGTLRSSAWTTLEVKPGETNGTKRLTGTLPGIWRKMKRKKMLQNQAVCLSETFHTPAPKTISKSSSTNMVRRELTGVFGKKSLSF